MILIAKVRCIVFALLLLAAPVSAMADSSPTGNDVDCQNADLISGRLLTDICWACVFPIRIAGVSLGGGTAPNGATDEVFCICSDNNGIPQPGLTIGLWEPARLIELVRKPGCSMALDGITLPVGETREQGIKGNGDFDVADTAFYHYHTYAFPLLAMLDLFVQPQCGSDGYADFDLAYMSELDPTWNISELAFFTQPEAAAVANPIAQAACVADAAAALAGQPLDEMFWCAGSWGSLYPFAGIEQSQQSMPKNTSLLAARALAAAHRRGLMWHTMGDQALCGGYIDPMFPKSQYKWSMFFPIPETGTSSITYTETNEDGSTSEGSLPTSGAHVTGQNVFLWGEDRQIPAVGEDSIYVVWRWLDCCSQFTVPGQ